MPVYVPRGSALEPGELVFPQMAVQSGPEASVAGRGCIFRASPVLGHPLFSGGSGRLQQAGGAWCPTTGQGKPHPSPYRRPWSR